MSRLTPLCVVLLLAAGCGTGIREAAPNRPSAIDVRTAIPSEAPSISGVVTAVETSGRIRVEENPSDRVSSAKAVIRITLDTAILDGAGNVKNADALSVGARVRVWYSGPAAQSYPAKATARVVVITGES